MKPSSLDTMWYSVASSPSSEMLERMNTLCLEATTVYRITPKGIIWLCLSPLFRTWSWSQGRLPPWWTWVLCEKYGRLSVRGCWTPPLWTIEWVVRLWCPARLWCWGIGYLIGALQPPCEGCLWFWAWLNREWGKESSPRGWMRWSQLP